MHQNAIAKQYENPSLTPTPPNAAYNDLCPPNAHAKPPKDYENLLNCSTLLV